MSSSAQPKWSSSTTVRQPPVRRTRALARVGADVTVTADPDAALDADGLVVPGVGAFAACMAGLRAVGGDKIIGQRLAGGRPVLGICVGMQVLFDAGRSTACAARAAASGPARWNALDAPVLPHMGWNTVAAPAGSALFAGIDAGTRFYFVHSYGLRYAGAAELRRSPARSPGPARRAVRGRRRERRRCRRPSSTRRSPATPAPPCCPTGSNTVMIPDDRSTCCPPSTSPAARPCAWSRARPAPRPPTATRWRPRWPGRTPAPSGSTWSTSTPRSAAAPTRELLA